jgi:hypothetical protein
MADQLARLGSEHQFIGPEPACGITVGFAKKVVRVWTNRNHRRTLGICNWTQTGKGLILRPSARRMMDQLRWVVGMFTGHLFKQGLTDDPTCV